MMSVSLHKNKLEKPHPSHMPTGGSTMANDNMATHVSDSMLAMHYKMLLVDAKN